MARYKEAPFDTASLLEQGFTVRQTTLVRYWGDAEEVEIPSGIEEIAPRAFENARGLKSVAVPTSVAKIGCMAFSGCSLLKRVYAHDLDAWLRLDFDGYYANPLSNGADLYVAGELLRELVLPDGYTEIRARAFKGCTSIESLIVPEGVVRLDTQCLSACTALQQVRLPESLRELGDYAFGGCASLKDMTVPQGVASMGDGVLCGCVSLESLQVPDTLEHLGISAFRGCASLTHGVLSSGVGEAPDHVFEACTALQQVRIPADVKRIGSRAFGGCAALSCVDIPACVVEVASDAFEGCKGMQRMCLAAPAIPKSFKLRDDTALLAPSIAFARFDGMLVSKRCVAAGRVMLAAQDASFQLGDDCAFYIRENVFEVCKAARFHADCMRYLLENKLIGKEDVANLAAACSARMALDATALLMDFAAAEEEDSLEL